MAGKPINQYNAYTGNADGVNILVQNKNQTNPMYAEHQKVNFKELLETLASLLWSTDVVNALNSQLTDAPLSAKMGYELNERINNVMGWGRYLALWDCTTGLPTTDPMTSPYPYMRGDHYIITKVGATNYKPSGTSYTSGTASTTVESGTVAIGYAYVYDGTTWTFTSIVEKLVSFANVAGSPLDNTALASLIVMIVGSTDHSDSRTYNKDETCRHDGVLYRCDANGVSGTWANTSSHWHLVTLGYIFENSGNDVHLSVSSGMLQVTFVASDYDPTKVDGYEVGDFCVVEEGGVDVVKECCKDTPAPAGTYDSTCWENA